MYKLGQKVSAYWSISKSY